MPSDNLKSFIDSGLVLASEFFEKNNLDKSKNICKFLLELSISENSPSPELWSNLVCLLCKQGDYKEAVKIADTGLGYCVSRDLLFNKAIALEKCGKYKEARDAYREVIKTDPEFPMGHWRLSNVLLALGEFKEGLKEDAWRFKAYSKLGAYWRRFNKPDWDGSFGKKILVFSEQGLGDFIQYYRYLSFLADCSDSVIIEVQKEIACLVESRYQVVPYDIKDVKKPIFPEHDFVLSINSLPFWLDPDLSNVPTGKYMNFPDGESSFDFSPYNNFLKVGIVWAGSPWHTSDFERSMFLRQLKPLTEIDGIKLFSLQTGKMIRSWCKNGTLLWEGKDDYDQVNLLEGAEDVIPKIIDLMDYAKDFCDTARFLKNLDVVVAVDTSTAHLAGALGVQVLLMLSYFGEWRWRIKWYDSMTVYKQKSLGDWTGVVDKICFDLNSRKKT